MLVPVASLTICLRLFSILIFIAQLCACGQVRSHAVPVVDLASRPTVLGRDLGYRVQAGDTLYAIAWRYNTRVEDLLKLNKINGSGRIHAGQLLRIPPPLQRNAKMVNGLAQGADKDPAAYTQTRMGNRPRETPSSNPSICCLEKGSLATVDTHRSDKSIKSVGWSWPVKGKVISGFMANRGLNKGIDIQSKLGEPVLAASDGQVVYAGNGLRDYGNLIILKHANKYLSAYGNNQRLLVKEGEQVRVGQKIAEVGSGSQGVLLHFEIRYDGQPLDPMRQLPAL